MARDGPRSPSRSPSQMARADARRREHTGAARSVRARLWLRQQRLCRVQGVREPQGEGRLDGGQRRILLHATLARQRARPQSPALTKRTQDRRRWPRPALRTGSAAWGTSSPSPTSSHLSSWRHASVVLSERARDSARGPETWPAQVPCMVLSEGANWPKFVDLFTNDDAFRWAAVHVGISGHPRFALGPPSRHSRVGGTCASRASHSTSTTSSQP